MGSGRKGLVGLPGLCTKLKNVPPDTTVCDLQALEKSQAVYLNLFPQCYHPFYSKFKSKGHRYDLLNV
jgi:hypothetical protein